MQQGDNLPKMIYPEVRDRNFMAALLGEGAQVALRYNTDHWELNLWDGNGWTTITATNYRPIIPVRGVYIYNGDEIRANLKYDLVGYRGAGDPAVGWNDGTSYVTGVLSPLNCGQQYSKRISNVYLDADTTALQIFLSA